MTNRKTSIWFHIADVLLNIVIIVGVVVLIRTFLVSPFQVEGESMDDTLHSGQYIIINKLAYHVGEPERGDIVVFRPPDDRSKHYVKRVVGMPGDELIIHDGDVHIRPDGSTELTKINEPYLNAYNSGNTFKAPPNSKDRSRVQFNIPNGKYFLLGDNRQHSRDSRSLPGHYVGQDDIKGRVWFVALPVSKIHTLVSPEYAL